MQYFFITTGVLFGLAGVALAVKPAELANWMRNAKDTVGLFVSAIVIRVLFAVTFIAFADVSSEPVLFMAFGLLCLAGALFVALLGRSGFASLLEWFLDAIPEWFYPIDGLLAILLGAFIVYAVL